MLAIIGAVILVLTYFVKDMLKEKAKDVSASVESGEALYRTESGQSTLSIQMLQIQQQFTAMKQAAAEQAKDGERDYSAVIGDDLRRAPQVRAHLNSSVSSLERFIDRLPDATHLRQQLEQLKPNIEKANQQADEAVKPSPKHDWNRLAEVKIAMSICLVQQIPVLLLGDAALTRARMARESAERISEIASWVGYVLYTLGVALALYGILSGIKSLGVGG